MITDSRGGQLSLAATGYLDCPEKGFLFVADESKPVVWKLNPADGSVLKTNVMSIEGLPQGMIIKFLLAFKNFHFTIAMAKCIAIFLKVPRSVGI